MISSHQATQPQSRILTGFFVPLFLCVMFISGCKKEEQKVLPQNRLTVEYSVDRENILIGDPVELIVTTYFPTNGMLELPEIGREKDVVLLSRDWTDVPREDGLTQSESRYSITSFRLGEHIISSGTISCAVNDEMFTTNFPPAQLNVASSLSADSGTQIADIQDIHKLPGRIPKWVWVIPGAALIAFIIGLITSRLWKNRETLIPSAPPVPPHIIAFQALEALKNKGLLEQDECNPFYTELSLILRTYLDGRFRLNAQDETTEEIVEAMSNSPELNMEQQGILRDFMTQADMVKFAKGNPDRSTMESAFDTTKQFVEETKGMLVAIESEVVQEEPQTETEPQKLRYAGFWIRLLAYFIDIIPIAAGMAVFAYFVLGIELSFSKQLQTLPPEQIPGIMLTRHLLRICSFVIWIVYGCIMELGPFQGSLGKRITGLKVVNADGKRLTMKQAVIRMLMKFPSYFFMSLGFLWVAFTKKKQGWYDMAAKSYVVYRKNKGEIS